MFCNKLSQRVQMQLNCLFLLNFTDAIHDHWKYHSQWKPNCEANILAIRTLEIKEKIKLFDHVLAALHYGRLVD